MTRLLDLLRPDPVASALYALQAAPIGASRVGSALETLMGQRPGTFEPIGQTTASMGPRYQETFGRTQRQEDEINARAFDVATNFAGVGPLKRSSMSLDFYGQPVRILQNPSPSELTAWLAKTKYKAGRRMVDPNTGDVFVWDGAAPALHADVAKQLGVPWQRGSTGDMIYVD